VLSGRGLCDELIVRPEESYRMWCDLLFDLENSSTKRPYPALGHNATRIKNIYKLSYEYDYDIFEGEVCIRGEVSQETIKISVRIC